MFSSDMLLTDVRYVDVVYGEIKTKQDNEIYNPKVKSLLTYTMFYKVD